MFQSQSIKIEGLSKKYHYGSRSSYLSLRDTLTGIFDKSASHHPESEFWAVKNVSFSVSAGEAMGLIGANGAGKSTLLKILSRITPPTSGQAVLRGRVASLLEVGTGFHQELTGRENVYLNGAILGMNRREIDDHFEEIVRFADTKDFLDTPIKHYSSGMRVRLAFAVAAHLNAEILFIDEVLSVGDAEFQQKCIRKMNDITTNTNKTIIYVSHNLSSVSKLCRRSVLLDKGQIVIIDQTQKVIETYLARQESQSRIENKLKFTNNTNKQAQILETAVLNHRNRPSLRLDMAKPFFIKISVRTALSHTGIFLGITSDLYDKYIFQSFLGDGSGKQRYLKQGYSQVLIKINPILNEGIYSFKISLVNRGKGIDTIDRRIVFRVQNLSGLPYKSLSQNSKGALVLVHPEWHITS